MVFATESYLLDQSLPLPASRAKTAQAQKTEGDRVHSKVVPLHPAPERPVPLSPLPLPHKPKLPLGLQLLNKVQQGSTVIAGFLMTGALVVYGSTVYIDKSTSHTLAQIDALQSESEQLTSANEAIKQSLAEQAAQANSGLGLHKSGDVLFLSPAPPRETPARAAQSTAKRTRPLGY
ncbi:MAG: hypothetical protein WBB01_04825 [Phormidesmis sp.]